MIVVVSAYEVWGCLLDVNKVSRACEHLAI